MRRRSIITVVVTILINNGAVKLSGSVQSSAQKVAAESAARSITNVRDVDANSLAVTSSGEAQP